MKIRFSSFLSSRDHQASHWQPREGSRFDTELLNIAFGHAEQNLEAVKNFDYAARRAEFGTVADQDIVKLTNKE